MTLAKSALDHSILFAASLLCNISHPSPHSLLSDFQTTVSSYESCVTFPVMVNYMQDVLSHLSEPNQIVVESPNEDGVCLGCKLHPPSNKEDSHRSIEKSHTSFS